MRVLLLSVFIGAIVSLTACGRKVKVQEACNFVQTSTFQRISWKHNLPIKMYIHESVRADLIPSIEAAGDSWEKVFGFKVFNFVAGTSGKIDPSQDGYSVIYNKDTWEPGQDDEQARTTVHWVGSRLFEADIIINDEDFDFFTDEAQAAAAASTRNLIHFESLMVHELGHVLGLAHNEHKHTVMKTILDNGEVRKTPSIEDEESIKCEYQTL